MHQEMEKQYKQLITKSEIHNLKTRQQIVLLKTLNCLLDIYKVNILPTHTLPVLYKVGTFTDNMSQGQTFPLIADFN